MLKRASLLLVPFALACAGEDRTAAPTTVTFTRVAPDARGNDAPQYGDVEVDASDPGSPLDGAPGDRDSGSLSDVSTVGGGDSLSQADASGTDLGGIGGADTATPKDAGAPEGDAGWNPDWVTGADPAVKGCLETFPAICDKVTECGEAQPLLGALGGFCPTVFDAIAPILTTGCGQLGAIVDQAIPGGLPLGLDLGEILPTLIKGCVENFECTPEYLQEFGATLQALVEVFTAGQAEGQTPDYTAALPALFELADKCGGIGNLIPGLGGLFGGGE